MQAIGISRHDYERLPNETKSKIEQLFEEIKAELRHDGFSLRFLGFDGHWKDFSPPLFLSHSEEHYHRLVGGSKWFTSTRRRDLVDKISDLYEMTSATGTRNEAGLEKWLQT